MSGRMVIPIHNERGRLVAYAGRAVDGSYPVVSSSRRLWEIASAVDGCKRLKITMANHGFRSRREWIQRNLFRRGIGRGGGLGVNSSLGGYPVVRQKFAESGDGMVRDARENVLEPGERIDADSLTGSHKAPQDRNRIVALFALAATLAIAPTAFGDTSSFSFIFSGPVETAIGTLIGNELRSEERRVGKERRTRWQPY